MLTFLDGQVNVKDAPNENYARELLELYSIGKGRPGEDKPPLPDDDYLYFTEQDVQAAARVLSGWQTDMTGQTIDPFTGLSTGRVKGTDAAARQHDNEAKVFSARLNSAIIEPDPTLLSPDGEATAASARQELTDLITLLFETEEAPRHICRRLYSFYVHPNVTETIEATVVEPLAQFFIDSDFDLHATLRELLTSQVFFGDPDENTRNGIIKSPLDLVVGLHIQLAADLPDSANDLEGYYKRLEVLDDYVEELGMDLFEPFEVAGYLPYHQFPGFHRNWITSVNLTKRYEFVRNLFMERNQIRLPLRTDLITYVRETVAPAIAEDAEALIDELALRFFPVDTVDKDGAVLSDLTTERLSFFLDAFLNQFGIDSNPLTAWTFRWNNRVDDETVENQLRNLFNALLQTPEYQLM